MLHRAQGPRSSAFRKWEEKLARAPAGAPRARPGDRYQPKPALRALDHVTRDRERGARTRRGGVANVQRAPGEVEHEVVHERAVASDRLCAHAGERRRGVAGSKLGHVARGRPHERSRGERVAELGGSRCATSVARAATIPARRACRAGRPPAACSGDTRRARPPAARSARSSPLRSDTSSGARRGTGATGPGRDR